MMNEEINRYFECPAGSTKIRGCQLADTLAFSTPDGMEDRCETIRWLGTATQSIEIPHQDHSDVLFMLGKLLIMF